ncbi:MAG: PTS fructose transporter subunit IIA [Gammaproteobacteria bacterium]|nr:PTS fructose transporter subunit IIA [Gammaproteobacteria bacterium]
MTVGLLIITHNDVGRVLLDATVGMLGVQPIPTAVLGVTSDKDPEAMIDRAHQLVREVDHGDGVLILTDLFGSTPSNVAWALQHHIHTIIISGVNLPMLLRVMNYPKLTLPELAEKALSGGRDGVLLCKDLRE